MTKIQATEPRLGALLDNVVVVGDGTAGWMTAAYLKKAFPKLQITVLEPSTTSEIGFAEATLPNLQQVFFDFLGIAEDEWMRECGATFRAALKFVNWRRPLAESTHDHFYRLFGSIPSCDHVSLAHYWVQRQHAGDREPLDYACYKEPRLLDARLAPRFLNGTRAMSYGWHVDPCLMARYLRKLATGWGVQRVVDELESVELGVDGAIDALQTRAGRTIRADLYIDCSGFRGLLINQALAEPFIDLKSYLLCDSALLASVPSDDATYGVEPYTSAIAMSCGWTCKMPMLGRFDAGYVYSSELISEAEATREFCELWPLRAEQAKLRSVRFRVGRNRRAWVKNCVSIGPASCFVEPLQPSALYFTASALYQLAKHFPDKSCEPALSVRFNREIERMFDDTRDFIQAHYLTAPREDSAFWRASKHELTLSDDLRDTLEAYESGVALATPLAPEQEHQSGVDAERRSLWSDGSYFCVLAGMGRLPKRAVPSLRYRADSHDSEQAFQQLQRQSAVLYAKLPTNYRLLHELHAERQPQL